MIAPNLVLISDYIQNGIVIKSGTVHAQVRAAGYGLFPNTSEVALTRESITLIFETTDYDLSFNLNGATGVAVTEPTREGFTFNGWNTAGEVVAVFGNQALHL